MHVGIPNQQCRGKRSRHSRRMRNPQFCVSAKRPMVRKTDVVLRVTLMKNNGGNSDLRTAPFHSEYYATKEDAWACLQTFSSVNKNRHYILLALYFVVNLRTWGNRYLQLLWIFASSPLCSEVIIAIKFIQINSNKWRCILSYLNRGHYLCHYVWYVCSQ